MVENVGIKSRKLYEISSKIGLCHNITLTWREYRSGYSIYILKVVISSKYGKTIRKNVYCNEYKALNALKECICEYIIFNIDLQLDLPI